MTPAGIVLRLDDWAVLGAAAAIVRRAVFVDEQRIPESLEWDGLDAVSLHAVAFADGAPVATGRLLPDARVGRMAVLAAWRGFGIGSRVLGALVDAARSRGAAEVELSSQLHACGFYARHGFEAVGEPYDDAGIPHRTMRRRRR
jgi:predicted GNAT family N-acyltransferase